MRTSSMRPVKNSPNTLLPPTRSGAVDAAIGPVCARFATCTPFTYSRCCAPSYVAARCVQVLAGSGPVPNNVCSIPPANTPVAGALGELLA